MRKPSTYKEIKNKTKPYIAVIIPVYNVEKYLAECLDSVLSQDYENYFIVAVDDCSTDNSMGILKQYASEHKHIHIVQTPKNSGLSYTRNYGTDYVRKLENRPTHILYMDSDDLFEPGTLKTLAEMAEDNDLVWFDYECYYTEGFKREDPKDGYHYRLNNVSEVISGLEWLKAMEDAQLDAFSAIPFALINFEYLNRLGLEFYNYVLYEDHTYSKILFLEADKIAICFEKFYIYRVRRDSICRGGNSHYPWQQDIVGKFSSRKYASEYLALMSWVFITEELLDYLDTKDENLKRRNIELFMPLYLDYISLHLEFMNRSQPDPLKIIPRVAEILEKTPKELDWWKETSDVLKKYKKGRFNFTGDIK